MLIGHLQFLVKTATLFFPEVSEATIDITIASKTNEVQQLFVKQCAYVQTLGNGKRGGKRKQFQNEECASLVWKQNKKMK